MSALQQVQTWGEGQVDTSTKFLTPPLSREWVRRDRLDRLVSLAIQHPLTLMTAPPGAGKTVLLSDWAHSYTGGTVAWLSVDEGDNDPGQFWRSVAAALRLGGPSNDVALDYWGSSDGCQSVDRTLRQATASQPLVLIVDDFHLVSEESIVRSVARLTHRLPSHVRLVIAGQEAPGFALQRLVLTGEAAVLGADDLRFTLDECAALVAQVAHKFIPLSDLEALTERSEGWATGLHLAARALRDEADPSQFVRRFSGAFGPVAEYMENEVLLRQPPEVVKFMLQTSVLGLLTPDLCCAVSGRSDADEILASLSSRSLFVVPARSGAPGYRYHRLLADLLRGRRGDGQAALTRNANLQAGYWFERAGDPCSAAHHFVEADAYEHAFFSIFSSPVTRLNGDISPETAGDLPPRQAKAGIADGPDRMYMEAAALIGARRVTEAARALLRLDAVAADGQERQNWRGRAEFLWAVHADRLGDAVSVLDRCNAAEQLMEPTPERLSGAVRLPERSASWSESTDAFIAAQLPVLAARAHISLGQPDEAETVLSAQLPPGSGAELLQPAALAMIAWLRGQLRDAYRLGRVALEQADGQGKDWDRVSLDARLALAAVLLEHDELDDAQGQLEAALSLLPSEETTHWTWAVEVDLVRVMIGQQRHHEALNRIGQLRQVGLRNPPPNQLLEKLNHVEVDCRLALGDLEGALIVARSIHAGAISCETMARIDLASGRPDRALARLSGSRSLSLGTEIRRFVLLACAEMQHGRTLRADEALCRAIDLGRPEGYIRPFVEEAAQILPLLRVVCATRPDPYLTQLIDHAERVVPTAAANGPGTMLEPLTTREREVLGYLPSHLTVPDIASRIYISPNTVKSHLKSIYRKMGAGSRGDAVTIAVSRGLL
jgi:LuxR family maltose regulon positive regulatory protein